MADDFSEESFRYIFDENISLEVRQHIQKMQNALSNERANKESERAEKEKALKQLEVVNGELKDSLLETNNLAPRAVIEYLENFVIENEIKNLIPRIKNISAMSREVKWTTFFDKVHDGICLYQCLVNDNMKWEPSTPEGFARRICMIYQTSCDAHHTGSHRIDRDREVVFAEINFSMQTINVIRCIAKTFKLDIVCPIKTIKNSK